MNATTTAAKDAVTNATMIADLDSAIEQAGGFHAHPACEELVPSGWRMVWTILERADGVGGRFQSSAFPSMFRVLRDGE